MIEPSERNPDRPASTDPGQHIDRRQLLTAGAVAVGVIAWAGSPAIAGQTQTQDIATGQTARTTLQHLIDIEAIRQLRYRFAAALDNKDWAALASVFTETVDADFSA